MSGFVIVNARNMAEPDILCKHQFLQARWESLSVPPLFVATRPMGWGNERMLGNRACFPTMTGNFMRDYAKPIHSSESCKLRE